MSRNNFGRIPTEVHIFQLSQLKRQFELKTYIGKNCKSIAQKLVRFRNNSRANVAVIFALSCVPLISAIGCAIDYSKVVQIRSKLQAAIDAASVGSIAKSSPAFVAAGVMSIDGPIPVGVTDAKNLFNGNISGAAGFVLNRVTASVARASGSVTSTVAFSANVPTIFLAVMGLNTITVTGTSSSTVTMPLYLDFYLLLDNSPSMGVAATPADVAIMVNNTPDQCAFACHDVTNPNNYFDLAKRLGVTMRIDVLRSATQDLMDTAAANEIYPNQFRMAIYTMGAVEPSSLTLVSPLTSNLTSAKASASAINLMTVTGAHTGDTSFTTIMPQVNSAIPASGPGTSGAPQKFLFFVSDGVADEFNFSCSQPLISVSLGQCQSPINPSLCSAMKSRGVNVAVLYTTYLALPTNSFYNQYIAPFNAGPFGPSVNSQIAKSMQSCASPGYYFEVSPTQGISQAMQAIFFESSSKCSHQPVTYRNQMRLHY